MKSVESQDNVQFEAIESSLDDQQESLRSTLRDIAEGTVQTLPNLVNRKWWWVTLLVVLGMAGLVRLGFWQLDRLDQRRTHNATVRARLAQEPFDLVNEPLPEDYLSVLDYRRVQAAGTFDYGNQIVLTNQPGFNGEAGIQLLTPLVFEDGRAVLVARGWVPQDLANPNEWPSLEEGSASVVTGLIQQSQAIEGQVPPTKPQVEWYGVNIPYIQKQMPYTLLPVFVLELPRAGDTGYEYPLRTYPEPLDEGSHLSYAIQWFMFAAILGFGYIQFVRLQDKRERRVAQEQAEGIAAPPLDEPLPHEPLGGRP